MSGHDPLYKLLERHDRSLLGPETWTVRLIGLLGGGLIGAGIALGATARLASPTVHRGWIWGSAATILLVGLVLVVLLLKESLLISWFPGYRHREDAYSAWLDSDIYNVLKKIERPSSVDTPVASVSPLLLRLWSTGQARPPQLDLVKLGMPPVVQSDISISQALEELRAED